MNPKIPTKIPVMPMPSASEVRIFVATFLSFNHIITGIEPKPLMDAIRQKAAAIGAIFMTMNLIGGCCVA